ncbi:hypothetical protein POUND7_000476 [Theobroma cacao]
MEIKLASHEHSMQYHCFRETDDILCDKCSKKICGAAYACLSCQLWLHESCAKALEHLPREITHPLHSQHHLILDWSGITNEFICDICLKISSGTNYACCRCDFELDLVCAFSAHDDQQAMKKKERSSADRDKQIIQHYCHRDPLVLYKHSSKEGNDSNCSWCDKPLTGKVSSSAPESMDSEAFVEKEMEEFGTIDDHLQQTLVRPLIHEHPLKFCEATEKFEHQYCRACRLTLSGPGYICEECPLYIHGYYLHDKCSHLPSEIQHPLHSHHGLNLYTRPPHMVDFIICDECGDISPGFIYLCEECDFKLDVKCAMRAVPRSELSTLKEAERETELFHFSHKHKLLFCNFRDPTYKRQCSFCRLQIFGPTYYCFRCGWVLHESCLKLPQVMQVPIHPQHILALSYARYGFCHACALKLLSAGYSYSCEECYLSFHITCADSLRRALKRDSHMHDLYYFGTEFQRFFAMYSDFIDIFAGYFCSHCGEICSGQAFYRCLECHINFHLECVTLPQIVKSKSHVHPLIFKDSFIEDDLGEYYCDVCEKERHSNDHIYYCEECQGLFVTHIECVLLKEEVVLSYLVPRERKKRTRKPYLAWRR